MSKEIAFTCPCCNAYATFRPIQFSNCDRDDDDNPCHLKGKVAINQIYDNNVYQYIYQCKNPDCQSLIIRECNGYQDNLIKIIPNRYEWKNFNDYPHVLKISKLFSSLYNQSYKAEQLKCGDIAGAGYRKAIEYLIKDYIIGGKLSSKKEIEKKSISQCIDLYIKDERIKQLSKRAFRLGNDQVHYYQEWKAMDLEDLKNIIKLVVFYIENELSSSEYLKKFNGKNKKQKNI